MAGNFKAMAQRSEGWWALQVTGHDLPISRLYPGPAPGSGGRSCAGSAGTALRDERGRDRTDRDRARAGGKRTLLPWNTWCQLPRLVVAEEGQAVLAYALAHLGGARAGL
jgi:hypothetical protein